MRANALNLVCKSFSLNMLTPGVRRASDSKDVVNEGVYFGAVNIYIQRHATGRVVDYVTRFQKKPGPCFSYCS